MASPPGQNALLRFEGRREKGPEDGSNPWEDRTAGFNPDGEQRLEHPKNGRISFLGVMNLISHSDWMDRIRHGGVLYHHRTQPMWTQMLLEKDYEMPKS